MERWSWIPEVEPTSPPAAKARAVRFHRGLCLSFFEKAVKSGSV